MTDTAFFPFFLRRPVENSRKEEETVFVPPQPLSAPVFIHDCVTPLGGETLLSLLMKKMQAEEEDQP